MALLTALALPAPAGALTAKYTRIDGLSIIAETGESDFVQAGFFGEPPQGFLPFEYNVFGGGASVVAGQGCKSEGSAAECTITGIRSLTVELKDGATNSFRYFGTADVQVTAEGGRDELRTSSGFDLIDSGAGDDSLRPLEGGDVVRAGPGNDSLIDEGGDDLLDGGPGLDDLRAATGDDELLARDGFRDTIDCGPGTDTLEMDLKDRTPPPSCEKVDMSDKDEGPNVRVLRTRVTAGGTGVLGIPLACPRVVRRGCAGVLSVAVRGAGVSKRRYAIRRSRRSRVRVRLGATARRALARRGRLRARLVSRERGVHGPKVTIRQLGVRRRRGSRRTRWALRTRAAQGSTSSTVSFVIGAGLRIMGTDGENRVRIDFLTGPARYRVRDEGGPIVAGTGCQPESDAIVSCRARGPRNIRAFLGGDDDRLEFGQNSAGGADVVVDGGPSFDRIEGGDGYDVLIGGTADEGTDDLEGNGGNDALFGGPGGDSLSGGLGNDFATGDAGDDRLFLQDQRVDRWCDGPPVFMEQYNLDGSDTAVCPADQF